MGFFKAIETSVTNQTNDIYKEIVKWDNNSNDMLMRRVTTQNGVITDKSRLFVQVGQCAIYTDNGAIKDIITTPGMYFMDTSAPTLFQTDVLKGVSSSLIETVKRVAYKGSAITQQAVYFFSLTQKIGLDFITPNTIMYNDPEWGPMEVKLKGKYSIQIVNPVNMLVNLAGTVDTYDVRNIDYVLEPMINSALAGTIGNVSSSFEKIPSKQKEIGNNIIEELNKQITDYGIEFIDIVVESVEVPDEIKKSMRERVSIKMKATSVNDSEANIYTKLNTAEAIKDMANNESSGSTILGVNVGKTASDIVNKNIENK